MGKICHLLLKLYSIDFFCTLSWTTHYASSIVSFLPRIFSDHNPLILNTDAITFNLKKNVRFEKSWLSQEGFFALVTTWWISYPLGPDLGNAWKFKIQFIRRKLRGWHSNFQGAKRRLKSSLIQKLYDFESLNESNSLTPDDISQWQSCQSSLHQLYHEEEQYWQQRSRLKWFFEGDSNTRFFSHNSL